MILIWLNNVPKAIEFSLYTFVQPAGNYVINSTLKIIKSLHNKILTDKWLALDENTNNSAIYCHTMIIIWGF